MRERPNRHAWKACEVKASQGSNPCSTAMIIRAAARDDIPAIAHVASTSYIDAFGEYFLDKKNLDEETKERRSEKYFNEAIKHDTIMVAVVDDHIVGYIQFGKVEMDFDGFTDSDIELRRLYILTDFHGQGAGNALMQAMLNHEKLTRVTSIYLEVWENNPKALKLYRKFGFEDTGKRRPFFENGIQVGEDSIFLKKI